MKDPNQSWLFWICGHDPPDRAPDRADIPDLLESLGFTGPLRRAVLDRLGTELYRQREFGLAEDMRAALLVAVSGVATQLPLVAWQEVLGRGAQFTIQQEDPVAVRDHGTVYRGRAEAGPAGSRPHIYLWFEPVEESACADYFWYQFARPRLLVVGEDETDEVRHFSFKTSGGATMKMGEWRADFIQTPLDRVNAAREAAGKARLPEFRPPGLRRSPQSTRRPRGKAYIGPSIPGHRGDGVVDAPNLCDRGPNPTRRTASTMSRVYNEYVKDAHQFAEERPAPGSQAMAIVTDFRSYLVCVDDPIRCLGYVEWTYTTRATMRYEWRPVEAMAMTERQPWQPTPIHRSACTYEVVIGELRDC